MFEDNKTCENSLDYEKEYETMREKNTALLMELADIKELHRSMEAEFIRLRAQMDVVHLIFGGGNR